VEEVGDQLEAVEEAEGDHPEAVEEDHQEEEDHWGVQPAWDLDKLEEEPNLWETPLKYLMENATEQSCSCLNGRSIGDSITLLTSWPNRIQGCCASSRTFKDQKSKTGSRMNYDGCDNKSTVTMSSPITPGYGPR